MRASLNRRDRKLLLGCGALVVVLIVVVAVLAPANEDDDPTPSSYSVAPHGARAAFQLLQQAGYRVERQDDSLAQLDDSSTGENTTLEHTTVIFAEPFLANVSESKEGVKQILDQGGRVLATGYSGGLLLPDNAVASNPLTTDGACDAHSTGLGELAGSGTIRMTASARWKPGNATQQAAYTCQGDTVAVTYRAGKGTVVWWANSLPLENAGIQQKDNLAFFLNSVGPPATTHVLWDESLHGTPPSLMSYTRGTPLKWMGWQVLLVGALLFWSYGRRSGPLRPDPVIPRTAQIEFVHSLGSLYQAANATQVAVADAYQQCRQRLEHVFAIPQSFSAASTGMSLALTRHFSAGAERVQLALIACEQAIGMETLFPKIALTRIQALHDCVPAQPNTNEHIGKPWKTTHR